jgi:hypothetical protein
MNVLQRRMFQQGGVSSSYSGNIQKFVTDRIAAGMNPDDIVAEGIQVGINPQFTRELIAQFTPAPAPVDPRSQVQIPMPRRPQETIVTAPRIESIDVSQLDQDRFIPVPGLDEEAPEDEMFAQERPVEKAEPELGPNQVMIGSDVYNMPANFEQMVQNRDIDGVTLYPIINNPNAKFGSNVAKILEQFVQEDEPFQITERMSGLGFEERRGTAYRPEDIGSATVDVGLGIGRLLEGPVRGIAGFLGEVAGGARQRKRFREAIPSVPTREELSLARLQSIPGVEYQPLELIAPTVETTIDKELEDLTKPTIVEEVPAEKEIVEEAVVEEEITPEEAVVTEEEKLAEKKKKEEEIIDVEDERGSLESMKTIFSNPDFVRYIGNIGSQMTKTSQIGAGIGLGAAQTFEERKLLDLEREKAAREAGLKFLEGMDPKLAKDVVEQDQELADTVKNYQTSKQNLENLDKVVQYVEEGATGLTGLFGKYKDQLSAALKRGGYKDWDSLEPRTKADALLKVLQQSSIRELLGETGKTISNLDRQIIADIFGDITFFTPESVIREKLLDTRNKIVASIDKDRATVNTKLRYFENVRQPSETLRNQYNIIQDLLKFDSSPYGVTPSAETIDFRSQFRK